MSLPLFDSLKHEMLQILQKPQLQGLVLAADLREQSAEYAEDSAISSDSEVKVVSEMSSLSEAQASA